MSDLSYLEDTARMDPPTIEWVWLDDEDHPRVTQAEIRAANRALDILEGLV